jgi:hypothetical protein
MNRWFEMPVGKQVLVVGRGCDLGLSGTSRLRGSEAIDAMAVLRGNAGVLARVRSWLALAGLHPDGDHTSDRILIDRIADDARTGRLGVVLLPGDLQAFGPDLWCVEADGAPQPLPGSAPTSNSRAIAAAVYARHHALSHSIGKCYAYVKMALLKTGVATRYLDGIPAKTAGPQLERLGYENYLPRNIMASPYDAPEGAIIVYDATPEASKNPHDKGWPYGHIEFRTNDGFASDYHSPNARTGPKANGLTGRGRYVIGIYVMP